MLKPVVTRNLMLDFLPDKFNIEEEINPARIFKLNNKEISKGEIIYLMTREFRLEDNWALVFAKKMAEENNRKLKVVFDINDKIYSQRQKEFLIPKIDFLCKNLSKNGIYFCFLTDFNLKKAGAVIVDFNPINLQTELAKELPCAVFEVDSHNIIPTRFISGKQEYSAATLRRKVYANIAGFLNEFPIVFGSEKNEKSEAISILEYFIENKLDSYCELKNDPNQNMTSNLSPLLHSGLISSQKIALKVLKSKASRINKESFLEELIVRKELADNFCLYAKSYATLDGIADWAKESLSSHKDDLRTYIYSKEEFENAKTHDKLWNACQIQLLREGKIHGYLRMYWAKKILEWSNGAEEALEVAIYLNDKYALDGCDSNGYVGILWSIGGVHDRAFSSRPVFGKIRYTSLQGCKNKFDVEKFVKIKK